ncbi:MAG: hypothetical protein HYU29_03835 [Chloroflexi bacterium]|nr:hypothetical protein [Chloroflexota bacterium]
MKAKTQLRPDLILRALILLGLVLIVLILFTGLRPLKAKAPTVSIAVLQRQVADLQSTLKKRALPMEQEAEQKAIGIFAIAERNGVRLTNWSSKAAKQPFGAVGDVNMMRSSLELRGDRDRLVAVLDEIKQLLGATTLLTELELRGSEREWLLRVTISQLLSFS